MAMRFDLQTLKAFVSVVEEGSIAAAAAREHLVASGISKRIAELEREAGMALLYRQHKGVTPTPAGSALFHHAKQTLLHLKRIESDLSEYAQGVRGHVRIFANTSAIVQFLPEDLAAFLARHPEIKIDLEETTSWVIVEAVENGVADIGVCPGHVPTAGLQVFPYHDDRLLVVTRAGHPLSKRKSVRLGDTLDYDHVGLHEGSSLHRSIAQAADALNRTVKLRIQVKGFDGLRRMVQAGHGVGILPEGSVLPYLKIMGLAAVPLNEAWAQRRFQLCVRDLAALPVPARLLVESLTGSQRASLG